jgi:uncharacterized cupin superfamily protein
MQTGDFYFGTFGENSSGTHSIVVGQRLNHDVADYPNKGKRIFRNEGLPWTLGDYDALPELGGAVGKK